MGPIYPSSALQAPRIEYGAGSSPLRVEGKTSAIPAAQLSAYNKGGSCNYTHSTWRYCLFYLQVETKPGGFLRGKCFAAPLNSNSLYCSYQKSRYIKILTFKYEQYIPLVFEVTVFLDRIGILRAPFSREEDGKINARQCYFCCCCCYCKLLGEVCC